MVVVESPVWPLAPATVRAVGRLEALAETVVSAAEDPACFRTITLVGLVRLDLVVVFSVAAAVVLVQIRSVGFK